MTAHNWVFLRAEDDFEANFELLIQALDTDLEYVREHTRLLTLAIDWDQNQRRRSAGLRGQELQSAEGWLAQSGSKNPQPTDSHRQFLAFSRATVTQFQRLVGSLIFIAFITMLALSIFAEIHRQKAEVSARIARSHALAAFAATVLDSNPERSLLLAKKAVEMTYHKDQAVFAFCP
jgi:hypothetical protein